MKRHYFYIRLSCESPVALAGFTERARPVGHIRDSGIGTAKSACSTWVELWAKERVSDVNALRLELARIGVEDLVQEITEIDRGEGKIQARQLDLLSRVGA
jgi:hypothetical protein